MDDRVLGDDAVLRRVGLDHLELDRSHASSDEEGVALSDGSIGCFARWQVERVCQRLGGVERGDGERGRTLEEVGLIEKRRAQDGRQESQLPNIQILSKRERRESKERRTLR